MTTPTTTNSQMHNDIMAADSRDRPPMLATGRYAQWQSCYLRYVDTKANYVALRKCITEGPYVLSEIKIPSQPTTDDTPAVLEQTVPETFTNISPENHAHYDAKAEAIHLILTRIGDDIYSTVDACTTAKDMWIAIERYGESIESYYSRFYKMMNEMVRNRLEVATMQYEKEVYEIRAEKIARNANPLALVATTQQYPDTYYQAPKSHKSYAPSARTSSLNRSHATTKHKGKELAKPITPTSESVSKEDNNPEQAQRDKDINKNVDTSPRYKNDNQTRQLGNQRTMIVVGARETVGNQAEKGVLLCVEQIGWLDDTDEELYEQELEAHYSFMAKIQVVVTAESGPTFDGEPLEQAEQNAEECDDERVMLANLIANLKLDTDENKKIQKNRDRYLGALHDKEVELEKYKRYNDCTIEKDSLERKLKETLGLLA
ncbi:hypothetical protein Tco_0517468 [Tanacetum coccineum]